MSEGEGQKSGAERVSGTQAQSIVPIWRFFFLFVVLVVLLLFLWKAIPVLLLLFAGALFAIAVRMISDPISKWTHMPRWVSLTIVIVLLISGGGVGFILSWPTMVEQAGALGENLQEATAGLDEWVRESERGPEIVGWIGEAWDEHGGEIWSTVAGVFTTAFGAIAALGLTLIIGIFLAYSHGLYVGGALRLVPVSKRKRAYEIIEGLGTTLRWWMVGQVISMAFLALTTWVMLTILGIPLAFVLALITGLLTFIPYLGPLVALAPILLVAFAVSPAMMLTVLVLYLVIQNIESNVVMPIVLQQTVHMPPVLTILAQILLGAVFGVAGVVLATPLLAAALCLVKMIYVEDILGDSMDRPLRLDNGSSAPAIVSGRR